MLRKRFWCKRVEDTGNWRRLDYIMRSLMVRTPHRIIFCGDEIGNNKLAGYVARTGEKRSAYKVLVRKPEGKRSLGRTRRR